MWRILLNLSFLEVFADILIIELLHKLVIRINILNGLLYPLIILNKYITYLLHWLNYLIWSLSWLCNGINWYKITLVLSLNFLSLRCRSLRRKTMATGKVLIILIGRLVSDTSHCWGTLDVKFIGLYLIGRCFRLGF